MKLISIITLILTCFLIGCENVKYFKEGVGLFESGGTYFQVFIIGDWDEAAKEWQNPSLYDTPIIKIQTEFNRGDVVVPFIVFETDGFDSEGNVDVTYDFKVVNPDGFICSNKKELIVFKGIPPKDFVMATQGVGYKFQEDDSIGKYSLHVTVKDNHKKIIARFDFLVELRDNKVEQGGI